MPGYRCWELPFYGIGLKMYDVLAGRAGLGADRVPVGARARRELLPTVRRAGPDRAACATGTASSTTRAWRCCWRARRSPRGAVVLNHCAGDGTAARGRQGARRCVARDAETGERFDAARALRGQRHRRLGRRGARHGPRAPARPPSRRMVAPSQGVHLVVDRAFLPGTHALMVPKTSDGRVLFAVPWLGKTILGTTDTPRDDLAREPAPFARRGRLHPARGRALPGEGADARRRALGLGRPAPAGQAAATTTATTPRRCRASTPCWSAARAWSP